MNILAKCPVCENSAFATVLEQPDAAYFPRTIVKCKNCGLLFVNPQPSEDELEAAYNNEIYISENIQTWDRKKKEYTPAAHTADQLPPGPTTVETRAARRIQTIRRRSPRGASILDIGCRGGEFISAAKSAGFNPAGVEISDAIAQFTSARTGVDIFSGTLEKFIACRQDPAPTFDIISMWDVIEHLTAPASTLKLANSALKTNGLLCLSTVNLYNYRYLIYKNNWRGFAEGQEHTLFFTPRSLGLLLTKCGFKPVKIVTRSIPPLLLKWLNIFKLGHELEAYAVKTHDA